MNAVANTPSWLAAGATGTLLYNNGAATPAWLATSTNGFILTLVAGAPAWQANAAVPTTRTLTGTAPITIDGGASADLSANRTIAITAASGAAAGSMSAADFTKLAGIQAASHRAVLYWGNGDIATNTPARFMSPGYEETAAPTNTIAFAVPSAGTLQNFRIHCRTATGNGNPAVYTIRKNGVATALTISLASNATDGSDLAHTVAFAAGDLIDITVTKAATIGTSPADVMASVELAA